MERLNNAFILNTYWDKSQINPPLSFINRGLIVGGPITNDVRKFSNAITAIPFPPGRKSYVEVNIRGSGFVKIGITSKRSIGTWFSDLKTGWSLFLKRMQLRHNQRDQGRQFIRVRDEDQYKVCVVLDRRQGYLDFVVNEQAGAQYAFEDDIFAINDEKFYLAISAISQDGLNWNLEYRPAWDDRRKALFIRNYGGDVTLNVLSLNILREMLSFM